jgi:hypothetical protein
MDNRFDELAKAVAEGMTRREVLSRLRGVLAGGALALLGMRAASAEVQCPHGQHPSPCHFLGLTFPPFCCPNGQHCVLIVTIPTCFNNHG